MATTFSDCPGDGILQGTDLGDRLFGKLKDDRIEGLAGDDKLYGGGGRDTLIGGEGNDVLRGDGAGRTSYADAFAFGKNSGKDTIMDFDVGKDIIVIMKGLNGIRNPIDVLDHAAQKGKNVVIDLGAGNKITLKNTDLDDLKKNPGDHFEVSKILLESIF